jgi:hypothetical protein
MYNIFAKHIGHGSAIADLFLNVVWSFVAATDFVLGLALFDLIFSVFGLMLFDLIFSVLNPGFSFNFDLSVFSIYIMLI